MTNETKPEFKITRTINFTEISYDLESLIKKSKQAYGFEAIADSDVKMKLKIANENFVMAFLTEDNEVYYISDLGNRGRILHKWSWMGGLFGGGVALAFFNAEGKTISITAKKYDWDSLRKTSLLWTTA